ncbi:thiol-activated cytolysin family protein [Maribacter chungangensis]|uniref:Thiol-activated cytolysin family protein n=1 Tax=Maribacter chungangensis TaxID=1069117 RepID=A0ABW3B424_9FLAO
MKTRSIVQNLLTLHLLFFLCLSCSSDAGEANDGTVPNPEPEPETIDLEAEFSNVIGSAGELPDPEIQNETLATNEANEIIENAVWNCTTTTYDVKKSGGTGRDGFPLFNPNASVIYPGSLLQGKSLKKATPDVIAVERAGGTISYNLNNGNLASSFTVDKVAKSSIQDAMNNIIASSPADLPANFSFNYSQVQSREALALSMGVDFENAFAEVSADFDFSTEREYNRILVELKQNFYTMSFDIPTSLKGLFADSVTPNDLAKYVQDGNPATYISDVSYGRIYYMLVESTSSYAEMNLAVESEFNAVVGKTEVDIDASALRELSEVKIKVMAFGGESSSTIRTIGGNLSELVNLLAESSTISTGLPLSYVVRSVDTNQIVGVQLATTYDVTECSPAPAGGEPVHTAHWKGQVLSRMGPVGAAFALRGTEFILISEDGKRYMRSFEAQLEGPFPLSELFDGEVPFGDDGIGAACNLEGNRAGEDYTIMVMSQNGLFYNYAAGGEWKNWQSNIEDLANGDNPLAISGVGAMLFNFKDPMGPSSRFMFNRVGSQYALYRNNPNSFTQLFNRTQWGIDDSIPFDVGAGIGFYLGNTRQFILFDITGTQYVISNGGSGSGDVPLGPFDL